MKLFFIFSVYYSMNIRYKLKRLKVKFNNLGKKKLELDEVQQKAYNIVIKMINDKGSNLMYDNIFSRRVIEHGEIFVSITKNHIFIINGVYYYDIFVDDVTRDNIAEKFDNKISRKINAHEQKAMAKVKKSLDMIFDNISDS